MISGAATVLTAPLAPTACVDENEVLFVTGTNIGMNLALIAFFVDIFPVQWPRESWRPQWLRIRSRPRSFAVQDSSAGFSRRRHGSGAAIPSAGRGYPLSRGTEHADQFRL